MVWPFALGALVLGACGDDDGSGATRSTIDLSEGSTAFVVRPTVPSSSTIAQNPGDVSAVGQEYTLVFGDYPLAVAQAFGITVDELVEYNGWGSVNEFPPAGQTILIPPGAVVGGAPEQASTESEPEQTPEEAAASAPTTTVPGETIPDAGDNCGEGRHTVVAGDLPVRLAEQYDVTLEALDAANAGNPAYNTFIPGQEIIIPAKADC
jgi:LysM repeat protein